MHALALAATGGVDLCGCKAGKNPAWKEARLVIIPGWSGMCRLDFAAA